MEKSSGSRSRKQRLSAVGTLCADYVTPLYLQKLALTSPTGGGRSVGIVRVRTKTTEFSLVSYRELRKHYWFNLMLKYLGVKKTLSEGRWKREVQLRVRMLVALHTLNFGVHEN